jgi:hypothetical protein
MRSASPFRAAEALLSSPKQRNAVPFTCKPDTIISVNLHEVLLVAKSDQKSSPAGKSGCGSC